MQSVSSRIWTRIAVFISYGDNDTPRAPPCYLCGESDLKQFVMVALSNWCLTVYFILSENRLWSWLEPTVFLIVDKKIKVTDVF